MLTDSVEMSAHGFATSFWKGVDPETMAHLRKMVKQETQNKLAAALVLFANRVAFAEKRRMGAADSIAAIGASFGDAAIVQMPAPPHPQSRTPPPRLQAPTVPLKPRWKSAPNVEYSRDDQALSLVNFDDAAKQLCKAHESCFLGATEWSRAGPWPIKLVDNPIGQVRSAFATQYIQRCIENWPAERTTPGFRESLCASRTFHIVLKPHAFVTATSELHDIKVLQILKETITGFIVDAI